MSPKNRKHDKAFDETALPAFHGPEGLLLKDVSAILEIYLRGISAMDLPVAADWESHTDTATIFLPPVINLFREPAGNFLVYKLAAAHKWAQISLGTLTPCENILRLFIQECGAHPDIEDLFGLFPEREFAIDLYNVIEAFRLETFLGLELPGLVKGADAVKAALFEERASLDNLTEKTALVEGLFHHYLAGAAKGKMNETLKKAAAKARAINEERSPSESIKLLVELYDKSTGLKGAYKPQGPPIIIGSIMPETVSQRLKAGRDPKKKRFAGLIAGSMKVPEAGGMPGGPGQYISLEGDLIEEEDGELAGQGRAIKYDEWDYKSVAYKKQWCSLYEQDVPPGQEPFVEQTLRRYGGYVTILRKKFELLKREPKILKRQCEGDEIDIDATVEAFSDMRAGLSPNENFFTRLDRQERNIAALFLVDMSGSTKGWVNEAEKESLVLMCESLEALGDRYAVYGFSGMARARCEYYTVKSFGEAYSDTVKKRIAGICPKECTRMGPPLRHSIHVLNSVEARTKLMITLSDGKPADWDEYDGDYAIEDTRKALLESRQQGIHPFCITIDKEAGSYLPHMYGDARYIVIDDVRKLPNRITEIYRRLTA